MSRRVAELPRHVKEAFLKFKQLEFQWLRNLPDADKKHLSQDEDDFDSNTMHHIRQYGEVGFTLAGVKPCVLICHATSRTFIQGLADNCLKPVIEQYNLDSKGFSLHYISHPLLTSNPAHPGFQGSYLFVNNNHSDCNLVKETFLVPHRGRVDELQIGRALGYPLPHGGAEIRYIDLTESEEQDTCCVPMLEYVCDSHGGYIELITHHAQYLAVWKNLGRTLTVDTEGHPRFAAWLQRQKAMAQSARR